MGQTLRELSTWIIYYTGKNVAPRYIVNDLLNCSMSLLVRINLALGAVFVVAALITGYACRTILEANAQREVFAQAGLMMDSALAIRDYTANEILPLLSER